MLEEKRKVNKAPVIAIVLVAVLGVIGGTFAYFTSTQTFPNVFRTKTYKTEISETFKSPSDWTPGTTTDKTVTAKNTGDIDIAVRVSYTEKWEDANGSTLPLKQGDVTAAVINFADDLSTKWTKSTENSVDYYYYKTKLAKNASTTSLIKSVTFNPNITVAAEPVCTTDTATNTQTCTTTSKDYAGGTYTLTVKVETVQFDAYKTAWNTNVTIS